MVNKAASLAFLSAVIMVVAHVRLDKLVHIKEEQRRAAIAVPQTAQIKLIDGGFDKLAADLYWLAFVQYCGVAMERGKNYVRSYDYVKLITDLDPHFIQPYWFGCWAIGYWQKSPDKADEILRTAIQRNPRVWELPYLAGINEYVFGHNAKAAARYYRLAAKDPGADAVFLNRQADILASNMPEFYKQRRTIQGLYEKTKDVNLKTSLFRELMHLLDVMYKEAPTPIERDALDHQKKELQEDFEKFLQES